MPSQRSRRTAYVESRIIQLDMTRHFSSGGPVDTYCPNHSGIIQGRNQQRLGRQTDHTALAFETDIGQTWAKDPPSGFSSWGLGAIGAAKSAGAAAKRAINDAKATIFPVVRKERRGQLGYKREKDAKWREREWWLKVDKQVIVISDMALTLMSIYYLPACSGITMHKAHSHYRHVGKIILGALLASSNIHV